jgi:hypothetical protein
VPGSRRRGSVGGRPRCERRASCPPAPNDSPSLVTHGEARRPARCAGIWTRLAGATSSPVLAAIPRWGDDPTPVGVGCHRAFYTGWPSCDTPGAAWLPAGTFMDADQCDVAGPWPGASLATHRTGSAQANGMHSHFGAGRHARTPGCGRQWP